MARADDSSFNGSNDHLLVNCGGCGTPLLVRLEDLMPLRTIDCATCLSRHRTTAEAKSDRGERALKRFEYEEVEARVVSVKIARVR